MQMPSWQEWKMMNKSVRAGLLIAACLCISAVSFANMTVPALECWMQVGDGDVEKWWPTGTANGDGTFHYSEDKTTSMWELNGDFTADPDPYVSSTAGILNTTGSTQTYTFTIVLPIAPPLANPTLHGGSTIVTLLDANGDGTATMGQSGSKVF